MANAELFRDQAAECLDRAKQAADLKIKQELLAMSAAWLDFADLVEQAERRQAVLAYIFQPKSQAQPRPEARP